MEYVAGLDWGGAGHAVCVLDAKGKMVDRLAVPHDADGFLQAAGMILPHSPTS